MLTATVVGVLVLLRAIPLRCRSSPIEQTNAQILYDAGAAFESDFISTGEK